MNIERVEAPDILPASSRRIKADIQLALDHFTIWCRSEGFFHSDIKTKELPLGAAFWHNLLIQSLEAIKIDIAPAIPRGEVCAGTPYALTKRTYVQFERWFQKEILEGLRVYASEHGGRVVRAHRISDMLGGDPYASEAKYFLTYSEFVAPPKQVIYGKRRKSRLGTVVESESSFIVTSNRSAGTKNAESGERRGLESLGGTCNDESRAKNKFGGENSSHEPDNEEHIDQETQSVRSNSVPMSELLHLVNGKRITEGQSLSLPSIAVFFIIILVMNQYTSLSLAVDSHEAIAQLINRLDDFIKGSWAVIF